MSIESRPPLPQWAKKFDDRGLMRRRIASINDLPIKESDRKYHWTLGRRAVLDLPGTRVVAFE